MIEWYVGDICVKGIPKITDELVVVALHTTHMTCMWIQQAAHGYYRLRAHRVYMCQQYQIGRGILFNTTWIGSCITSFLKAYRLQHAFITFMPDATSVTHGFVACATSHPASLEFDPYRTKDTMHAYHYLYPNEEHRFVFYWYRIAHTLLMQYSCIIIRELFNCIAITPRFCALLAAYTMIQGVAFRPSQLALDMQKVNNRISLYFTKDMINRCVQGIDMSIQNEHEQLLDIISACGLLYMQREL